MEEGYEWRGDAACVGVAHDYPVGRNPFFQTGRGQTYQVARRMCSGCPVVVDCLIDSLEEPVGMFGCTAKSERDGVKRSMKLGIPFIKAVEQAWKAQRDIGPDKAPPKSIWKEWG